MAYYFQWRSKSMSRTQLNSWMSFAKGWSFSLSWPFILSGFMPSCRKNGMLVLCVCVFLFLAGCCSQHCYHRYFNQDWTQRRRSWYRKTTNEKEQTKREIWTEKMRHSPLLNVANNIVYATSSHCKYIRVYIHPSLLHFFFYFHSPNFVPRFDSAPRLTAQWQHGYHHFFLYCLSHSLCSSSYLYRAVVFLFHFH